MVLYRAEGERQRGLRGEGEREQGGGEAIKRNEHGVAVGASCGWSGQGSLAPGRCPGGPNDLRLHASASPSTAHRYTRASAACFSFLSCLLSFFHPSIHPSIHPLAVSSCSLAHSPWPAIPRSTAPTPVSRRAKLQRWLGDPTGALLPNASLDCIARPPPSPLRVSYEEESSSAGGHQSQTIPRPWLQQVPHILTALRSLLSQQARCSCRNMVPKMRLCIGQRCSGVGCFLFCHSPVPCPSTP